MATKSPPLVRPLIVPLPAELLDELQLLGQLRRQTAGEFAGEVLRGYLERRGRDDVVRLAFERRRPPAAPARERLPVGASRRARVLTGQLTFEDVPSF
ncbi:MAG: hypothetical protein LC640_09405 [Frankia sp.]|nr:hypothetical protein [Frankia sp.]